MLFKSVVRMYKNVELNRTLTIYDSTTRGGEKIPFSFLLSFLPRWSLLLVHSGKNAVQKAASLTVAVQRQVLQLDL
jgi:hypothetical protein